MKINPIETLKTIPTAMLTGVKAVGKTSINGANIAKTVIVKHTPNPVKSIKTPGFIKTAGKFVQEHTPEFIKTAGKFVKDNKEAFVGGAVIAAAIGCAATLTKTIVHKIKEAKAQK